MDGLMHVVIHFILNFQDFYQTAWVNTMTDVDRCWKDGKLDSHAMLKYVKQRKDVFYLSSKYTWNKNSTCRFILKKQQHFWSF